MANGQTPNSTNDTSTSHTHMPTYSSNTNGSEPKISGTAKAPPSQSNVVSSTSSASVTSSSVVSGGNETPSKTWDFGDGTDSASNTNVPATDSASSVGAHASSRGSVNQSQTPTQSQTQSQQSTQQDEGNKTALGASKAARGTEGDRAEQPAEDEGGAAKGEAGSAGGDDDGAAPEPEGGYPEQLHAGKLEGLGPEYADKNRVTMTDRMTGLKERVKGAIKHDPELKQTGKDRMTGELKRKEREEEQSMDPFNTAEDESKDSDKNASKDQMNEDEPQRPDNIKGDPNKTTDDDEAGTTQVPHTHPTDEGRREQAASVNPEGSQPSNLEKRARSNVEEA